MQDVPIIAIDGPASSGKGTIAQRVAEALGFHYLDSGALYRLVALAAMRRGLALDDEQHLSALAQALNVQFDQQHIRLDGEDVTTAVRAEAVGNGASQVAALPLVRQALVARQRAFAQPPGLVADGRDMGSVIFPQAILKVYLTASPEVRADRRVKQLMEKGIHARIADVLKDIRQRDARDSSRPTAPLQMSADARLLDTSSLTIDDTVAMVLLWYAELDPK